MYLEAKVSNDTSGVQRVYFGRVFNTLDKAYASCFYSGIPIDCKKVEELKNQGWKEEVVG